MNPLTKAIRDWFAGIAAGWNKFWFTPSLPHTLALVRICGGAMLFYTHAVWTLRLNDFLGSNSWLNAETSALLNRSPSGVNYAWSYLYYIESPALLYALHFAGLLVFAMLTVGWHTHVVAVLAWIVSVSYVNRLTGTLFGLDQINIFIATYLMVGDSGGAWSLDRWLASQRGTGISPVQRSSSTGILPVIGPGGTAISPVQRSSSTGILPVFGLGSTGILPVIVPRIDTNIAIRLLQLHMCVIYLFGGIHKMRGEMWWDGSALWYAFASLEYQSIDMLWTAKHRWLLATLTHITVFWETFYCFLVWPRLTRPICIAMAVGVHAGIGLFLGMKTFGLAMIIGNLAFVYPETVAALAAWFCGLVTAKSKNVARPAIAPRESLAVAATR